MQRRRRGRPLQQIILDIQAGRRVSLHEYRRYQRWRRQPRIYQGRHIQQANQARYHRMRRNRALANARRAAMREIARRLPPDLVNYIRRFRD